MDGRFFNGRELKCFYWDGKTNYRVVKDTVSDQQKRLDAFGFGKWLETNLDEVEIDIDEEQEGEEEVLGDGDKTPEKID